MEQSWDKAGVGPAPRPTLEEVETIRRISLPVREKVLPLGRVTEGDVPRVLSTVGRERTDDGEIRFEPDRPDQAG